MKNFLNVARALSDPGRLRILLALEGGPLCVCQILELLELAPSTVSKHLSILYQAGLIEQRKCGRWVYYRQPEDAEALILDALQWTRRALKREAAIGKDRRQLKQILKMDPAQLCQLQLRK